MPELAAVVFLEREHGELLFRALRAQGDALVGIAQQQADGVELQAQGLVDVVWVLDHDVGLVGAQGLPAQQRLEQRARGIVEQPHGLYHSGSPFSARSRRPA